MDSTPGRHFDQLVAIMARLRAPDGCPWDREQTFATLRKYLLEETYEVLDAIDREHWDDLAEELGDLLLQPVFLARMAEEAGHFDISAALQAINEKLIRRHPHVFADGQADTAEDVKQRWDEIKAGEKADRPQMLLDSVPRALPALVEAQKISSKAAKTGFDWPDAGGVLAKLDEELAEVKEAREKGDAAHVAEEIGDLLFVVVNLARFLNVDAEQALRGANAKFRKRFAHVEASLAAEGRSFEDSSLEEMEGLWQQAKRR